MAADFKVYSDPDTSEHRWVNFEGADEPSEGKYAICIPLAYSIDPTNDALLTYEMNDEILPPHHGLPSSSDHSRVLWRSLRQVVEENLGERGRELLLLSHL